MENIAQGMRDVATESRANSERVAEQNRQNQAALFQVRINTQVNERLNTLMTRYENPDDYRYWAQSIIQEALSGGQKEIQAIKDPMTRSLAQSALISQAGKWTADMENSYQWKVQTKTFSDASQTLQDMLNAADSNNAEDYYYRGMGIYESLAAAGYIKPDALLTQSQRYGEQLHTLALTREINKNPDTLIALGTEAAQEKYFRADPVSIRQLYDSAIDRQYTLQQRSRTLWEQHTQDAIGRLMIDMENGTITRDEYNSRLMNMAESGRGAPHMIASALADAPKMTGDELVNLTIDVAKGAYGKGASPEDAILQLPIGPSQRMRMLDIWGDINTKMQGPTSIQRNITLGLNKFAEGGDALSKLNATALSFLTNRMGAKPASEFLIPVFNRLGEQYGEMLGEAAIKNIGTANSPGQGEIDINGVIASATGVPVPIDKKTGAPMMEQFITDWVNKVIDDFVPEEERVSTPTKSAQKDGASGGAWRNWNEFWHNVYEEDRERSISSSADIEKALRDLRKMRNDHLRQLSDALGMYNIPDIIQGAIQPDNVTPYTSEDLEPIWKRGKNTGQGDK
jgi:hypothetical protein